MYTLLIIFALANGSMQTIQMSYSGETACAHARFAIVSDMETTAPFVPQLGATILHARCHKA